MTISVPFFFNTLQMIHSRSPPGHQAPAFPVPLVFQINLPGFRQTGPTCTLRRHEVSRNWSPAVAWSPWPPFLSMEMQFGVMVSTVGESPQPTLDCPGVEVASLTVPAPSVAGGSPGRVRPVLLSVAAAALVFRPVTMATRRSRTKRWDWAPPSAPVSCCWM